MLEDDWNWNQCAAVPCMVYGMATRLFSRFQVYSGGRSCEAFMGLIRIKLLIGIHGLGLGF